MDRGCDRVDRWHNGRELDEQAGACQAGAWSAAAPVPDADWRLRKLLDDLASQVKLRFHLAVTVLPQRSPDRAAYNNFRRQFEADKLLESVRQAQPTLANDPDVRLIAITPYDLYWNGKPEWRFTFGVREENRLAIILYARIDPVNLGDPPNDEVLRSRLRKMLTKDVGLMCLGLAVNDNPRSALYGNVLGVDELDVMTEEFDPKQ